MPARFRGDRGALPRLRGRQGRRSWSAASLARPIGVAARGALPRLEADRGRRSWSAASLARPIGVAARGALPRLRGSGKQGIMAWKANRPRRSVAHLVRGAVAWASIPDCRARIELRPGTHSPFARHGLASEAALHGPRPLRSFTLVGVASCEHYTVTQNGISS
jgi:hypothetical protein